MRIAIRGILMFIYVASLMASSGQIKTYNKQSDLLDGKAHQVSISGRAEIMLAPRGIPIFESGRPFIWDLEIDLKGNVLVATGDRASIYLIPSNDNAKIIAQWNDVESYALAIDSQGNYYAGTSPDGKIYRIFSDRAPQLWVELGAKYIWDITFDQRNRCFVATGDSGDIYVIESKGSPKLLFRSSETHIRCLSWDNGNRLLAGSYPHGYIYRFDNLDQPPMVIYDAPYQEIHLIYASRQGHIYAAAMGKEVSASVDVQTVDSDKLDKLTEIRGFEDAKKTSEPKKGDGSASGIIKIQSDNLIKEIWQSSWGTVQAIAPFRDDALLVGTSDHGRLYLINDQDEITYLMSTSGSHIMRLKASLDGKMYIGTSNLGNVVLLKNNYESQGSYESKVFDAKITSHWGKFQYDAKLPAGCSVKLYTRSGNTEQTNNTWSSWFELAPGGNITSPEARFLQWKLVLETSNPAVTPTISQIKLSYLQTNIAPELLTITIDPIQPKKRQEAGVALEPMLSEFSMSEESFAEQGTGAKTLTAPDLRRALPEGYRRVSWQARDQNNDRLTFDLYIQSKDESTWRQLKEQFTHNWYVWDSRLMPDGMYRFKIIAHDKSSNPIPNAKKTEKLSDWFIIDNDGPYLVAVRIKKGSKDSLQINFTLQDDWSSILEVQISMDMQNWVAILPIDQVADTQREDFLYQIQVQQERPASIVVKAKDASENISYSRIKLEE
ncbi:MAG: hypothetical protein ONB31_00810 [candidate division KSB1 bacterium]|nr:hypothetical protein [candidate division KSB1 bacterium]MDZ7334341.1 hypothetical protein [candidate division KSB1 bacterium]